VSLLAGQFRRMGYDVDVLTERVDPALARYEEHDGILVRRIGAGRKRRTLAYARLVIEMVAFLVRRRHRYRFAIVRTLTFPTVVVGVLKAFGVLRYPTLATAETGGDEDDVVALRGYPGLPFLRWALRHHDRLNSICAANRTHYLELGFPEDQLTYIYNGVATDMFAGRQFPAEVRAFGFLGRLHPEKGLFELVEAFAGVAGRHPEARLLIAGSGEAESALRELVAARSLARQVEFLGRIEYEHLGAFFDGIDCLVLPSYSEGLPLSVLEAAAHKRVIVATDVSDLRLLFGANIFLVRVRDAADLGRAMEQAMEPGATGGLAYDDVISRVALESVARDLEAALTSGSA
jgi:glycosyltransferase involved in cell wall biosynthesis